MSTSEKTSVCPADEVLPLRQMILLGIQHSAVAYVGCIAVPLIIASGLGLSQSATVILISTTLFCTGIATLLQTIGVRKVGVKLPILQGVAFSAVAPVIAIGSMPGVGLPGVAGAVMAAGVYTIFAAPFVGQLRRFFPPIVTGCIVTGIGLQLLPAAYHWIGAGGQGANGLLFLGLALFVLLIILLLNRFGSFMLRNMAVLIALIAGGFVTVGLGTYDFGLVKDTAWVSIPTPFYFGLPTFSIVPIFTMIIVLTVQMVESMGLFIAIGDIAKKDIGTRETIDGLRANGVASAIAGCFAAFPFIAFMENVGILILTGVRSRWVVATAGIFMCVIAVVPKTGALIAALPDPVIGGAGLAMFGVVVAYGIRTLSKVDYEANEGNILVVGVTIALAAVPILAPGIVQAMPQWLHPFMASSVIIACVASVILNLAFNGLGDGSEQAKDNADAEDKQAPADTTA